jgi:hypothetical protein
MVKLIRQGHYAAFKINIFLIRKRELEVAIVIATQAIFTKLLIVVKVYQYLFVKRQHSSQILAMINIL